MNLNFLRTPLTALILGTSASLLAPTSASAATVSGNAVISIDQSTFSTVTGGWNITGFFDSSFNTTPITSTLTGGSTSTSNMVFPVNSNATTTNYPGNRSLQATTMDTGNTAAGQIGLSGALRMEGALGLLLPYDFTVQKFGGVWNLVTHDTSFQATTFLQLANVSESINGSGQLSLTGDLIFGNNFGPTTAASPFFITWGQFLSVPTGSRSTVVGSFSLNAPTAVPVPAAVWLFGSAVAGLIGVGRRKQGNIA